MSSNPEELIKKYLNDTCTPEERALVESWYNAQAESSESEKDTIDYEQLENDIWKELKKVSRPSNKINWTFLSAAAACVLICFLFYFTGRQTLIQEPVVAYSPVIKPGSNKAELVLEDGTVLPLSNDTTGVQIKQNGAIVTRSQNGRLTYNASNSPIFKEPTYNVLLTPRGGQYQIDLPDGTRAWLNAASSLKFPTVFDGEERRVEATGEIYFEVTVNKSKPFKVVSNGQTIVVLGTHFNLNAYADEKLTKTSLLEGSVRVVTGNNAIIIKPGEQSVFNSTTGKIKIGKIDVEEILAWRDGYFEFENEDVKSIMRKLSRWYDVEVDYSKDFVNQRFTGSISRFEDAAKVLKMLEHTGTIHFKTEGRRVTVMR